jgi:hypothetical protein
MAPLLQLVAVRAHCNACGARATLTSDGLQDDARIWTAAHYLPVVDEMELADAFTGDYVCTWRRQVAA